MTSYSESAAFDDLVRAILWLDRSLETLHPLATSIGVPTPVDTEWFSLLRKKLVPQLSRRSHLVVAVTGGTNTGKSVLFNQLAGEKASAADARAAGTKHPVCLLPPGCEPDEVLPHYFEMFEHHHWKNAYEPLETSNEHRLFWNVGQFVPERLLLVDTPDIDSDVEVNWERARNIRQVSDLLIAVLTNQKYNDAAVKRYFREAAEAGKPVILIWNMAYDEQYRDVWPEWIAQFRHETGVNPIAVFATPHNRVAADNMSLAVYDIGLEGRGTSNGNQVPRALDAKDAAVTEPRQLSSEPQISLREYLNLIRYDELKMQALLGAIRRLDSKNAGIRKYIEAIDTTSNDYHAAAQSIRDRDSFDVEWPAIPKALLTDEINRWCNSKRPDVLQNVSAVYNTVLAPVQWVWGNLRNRLTSKQQRADQKEELAAVIQLVEKTVVQLKTIGEHTSNPVLKQELNEYLNAKRKWLIEKGEAIHAQIPPKTDERIRGEVFGILNQWATEKPDQWQTLHRLDVATLGTHAVLSAGAILTCGALAATTVIGATGIVSYLLVAGGSEALLKVFGEEIRLKIVELKVQIQQKYAQWRKGIFLERFESELWGEMLRKFDANSQITASECYLETTRALNQVRKLLEAE